MKTTKRARCPWVPEGNKLYCRYHDEEWGVPVHDDRKMFEFLVLESAQAGLSWLTVLKKREAYREAFHNFDPARVAKFGARDVNRLLKNAGLIRNRAKINAAVSNARAFLEIQKESGSFSRYLWAFVSGHAINHCLRRLADYRPTCPEADLAAAELKKRGFKFLGPTTMYAHFQATGLVNDHVISCFRY